MRRVLVLALRRLRHEECESEAIWATVKTSVSKEGRSKREGRRQRGSRVGEEGVSNSYFTSVIDPNISGRAIYCIYK